MDKFFIAFVKLTGWLPQKLFLRIKCYYEDKAVQGRKIKGPAILISNHTTIFDFAIMLFVFFGRTLRYQMAEVLFRKKSLKRLVRKLGGIFVDRDSYDFSFLARSADILRQGGVLGVFPESRIPKPGETRPLPFKPSFVYLALQTGAPVIPVYTNGSYFKKERCRVIIGKPVDVCALYDPARSQRENMELLAEKLRQKIIDLSRELERQRTLELTKPDRTYFSYLLAKVLVGIPALLIYRTKKIYENDAARQPHKGAVMIYANHQAMTDPIVMLTAFWYRNPHFLALIDLFRHPLLGWTFRSFHCVPVDRDQFSYDSYQRVLQDLNAGKALVIFPEGHVKTEAGKPLDVFKHGVTMMSVRGNAPMLPVYMRICWRILSSPRKIFRRPMTKKRVRWWRQKALTRNSFRLS